MTPLLYKRHRACIPKKRIQKKNWRSLMPISQLQVDSHFNSREKSIELRSNHDLETLSTIAKPNRMIVLSNL